MKSKTRYLLYLKIVILAPLLLICYSPVAKGQTAKEIVQKMDDNMRGEYTTQEMTMTIVRPTWERSVSMKAWSRGQKYSLILITAPAKEKGQAFLKRDKEMWNWAPSIDRMIKIPPSMMAQSWMGSDFTNDDLVKESSVIVDYDHSFIGEEQIEGRDCYKIKLIPKEDAAVVWGKIIVWITKRDYLELKVEFYDEDGYLMNTQTLTDIKTMGGRTIPTHWEMIPADEEGKKTVISIEKSDFNTPIPESFFSQQNMKRVR